MITIGAAFVNFWLSLQTVQGWWSLPDSQSRHISEGRYPGLVATIGLHSLSALLDYGLRPYYKIQVAANINPELLL